jgi:transposase
MRNIYPSNLSDYECETIKVYFEVAYSKGGKPFKHVKREIMESISYVLRTDFHCHYLPKDFPPCNTVYTYFKK